MPSFVLSCFAASTIGHRQLNGVLFRHAAAPAFSTSCRCRPVFMVKQLWLINFLVISSPLIKNGSGVGCHPFRRDSYPLRHFASYHASARARTSAVLLNHRVAQCAAKAGAAILPIGDDQVPL